MQHIFLGIFPPEIASILLPIIVFGALGFLLSYAHRYLGMFVLPLFIFFCLYTINFLEFIVDLVSGYMLIVYLAMFLSVITILLGTKQSWNRYKKAQTLK